MPITAGTHVGPQSIQLNQIGFGIAHRFRKVTVGLCTRLIASIFMPTRLVAPSDCITGSSNCGPHQPSYLGPK